MGPVSFPLLSTLPLSGRFVQHLWDAVYPRDVRKIVQFRQIGQHQREMLLDHLAKLVEAQSGRPRWADQHYRTQYGDYMENWFLKALCTDEELAPLANRLTAAATKLYASFKEVNSPVKPKPGVSSH